MKGNTFQTLDDVENFINTLQAQHYPLKIYKSEWLIAKVSSYQRGVGHSPAY